METLKFDTTKMVTTWWDFVDLYVLEAMLAVSAASLGIQNTQERLICIPAVNCSDFPRNDLVVRRWKGFNDVSDTCNQSSSLVVLTNMSDRRQYDYVDNECYKKMHWFSAYYSLIFLAEAIILLVISNFWHKCPDSANTLAYCEHLISGPMMKWIDTVQPREEQQKHKSLQEFKTGLFLMGYGDEISIFILSSVTTQYRLRGVVGLCFSTVMLILNASGYFRSTEWIQCHLDGHIVFSTEHRFFQCTRFMETYFHIVSILVFGFVSLHLAFAFGSFVWSVTGKRREPEYTYKSGSAQSTIRGDAAFFFHLLRNSNYAAVRTMVP